MAYPGKIIDSHVHIFNPTRADEVIQMEHDYGYNNFNILSLEAIRDGQNEMCIDLAKRTDCTFYAGLNHKSKDYAAQARNMLAQGAKGYKMIEGKPGVYRDLSQPLTAAPMMEFYGELEKHNAVLLLHAGDPPDFWSNATAPSWAVENGWTYDDPSFPSLEKIRGEVEEIAAAFPKLKFILAHFYFIADSISEAARILDSYPCVVFDLCPGTEMYSHFSKKPQEWREFFVKYQDRILFGTDNYEVDTPKDRFDKDEINRLVHTFLQTDEGFKVWDLEIQGINLPLEVLEKIYYRNFEKLIKGE